MPCEKCVKNGKIWLQFCSVLFVFLFTCHSWQHLSCDRRQRRRARSCCSCSLPPRYPPGQRAWPGRRCQADWEESQEKMVAMMSLSTIGRKQKDMKPCEWVSVHLLTEIADWRRWRRSWPGSQARTHHRNLQATKSYSESSNDNDSILNFNGYPINLLNCKTSVSSVTTSSASQQWVKICISNGYFFVWD